MARSSLRYALPFLIALFALVGVQSVASAENPVREERTFEAWQVIGDKTGVNVVTKNAAGAGFGWICTADGCIWMIGMDIVCEPGATYPVLASAGAGASPLTLECIGESARAGYWRYQITPDGAMAALVANAKHEMGIVMSKVGGQFEVLRFSMRGYGTAMNFWPEMMDRWLLDSGPSAPAKSDKPARQLL